MSHPVVLAVDIGTSSVRAALYSREGEAAGLAQTHHEVLRPASFLEEQNPDVVRTLVYDAMAASLTKWGGDKNAVQGVAFSSQMYSVFPVDVAGHPLHNSILWSDGRAEEEARELCDRDMAGDLYRATGCPVNSLYPLAKILWFRRHRPDLFTAAARFVSIKEYVIHSLIQDWVTDHSMASGTGMFDLSRECWSEMALAATGLDADNLPRLSPGTEAIPIRNLELASRLGLPKTAVAFLGGGDGPLANIGSGASRPGGVNIDLGTSGAMRMAVDKPAFDTDARLWCYAMFPGRWAYGGIVSNVGNAMQWLGANLAFYGGDYTPDKAATRMGDLAAEAPAGADGVLCLPYFRKARSPHWDERLRGMFLGLTASHDIRHMARAVLEAVAFDLAAIQDIAAKQGPISRPIVLTGGLSRNRSMPQLIADVLETPVETPAICEGSLAGAAILGLYGAGLVEDYSFARKASHTGTLFDPNPVMAERYRAGRVLYAKALEMSRQFAQLATESAWKF